MEYSILYAPDVKQEVKEAKSWYKAQKPGLEKHFAIQIKIAIEKLSTNPLHYSVRHKNIRAIRTKIFPYTIYYVVDYTTITILAIVHNNRKTSIISNNE